MFTSLKRNGDLLGKEQILESGSTETGGISNSKNTMEGEGKTPFLRHLPLMFLEEARGWPKSTT